MAASPISQLPFRKRALRKPTGAACDDAAPDPSPSQSRLTEFHRAMTSLPLPFRPVSFRLVSFRPALRRLALAAALMVGTTLGSMHEAAAQERATMVADNVALEGNDTLTADGNVEVLYKGRRLRAARVVYDQSADRLAITGPILLTTEDGNTVILADQAALDADLTNGVMTGVRMVLNRQMQLAAAEMQRVGGRYTQLSRSVASSCKVCEGSSTPLWEIRARKVVHDELAQQIYFSNAQFRVAGLPVFWLPRLRMPDPTLDRSNGFLRPELRTTSGLGSGLKLPYFITLGRSADVTLTPYITTKNGRTLEYRYRQAFSTGTIEFGGAFSRDELLPGETRAYVTAKGQFALPQGFELKLKGEYVTDRAYLLDYGYPEDDRLESRIEATRTRRNEYISARLISIQTIRDGESQSTIPSLIGDFTFHRRFSGGPFGGEAGLRFQTHSQLRTSSEILDLDDNGIADGRDMSRASLRADWRRNWVTEPGIVATLLGEGTADLYKISEDAVYGGDRTRLHGSIGAELRWPWVRAEANGVSHMIEPVAQLVWSPGGTERIPNEDSQLVEFDESNLFSLNRFPGSDATERGTRANLGLTYTRYDPEGWTLSLAGGRVFRTKDYDQFSNSSGLGGRSSDWLLAWQLRMGTQVTLTNRILFDDDLSLTKGEWRLDVTQDRFTLSSGYVWLEADEEEERPDQTSELQLDARFDINPSWTATAATRYDFDTDQMSRAGLGLAWRNECVELDLSLSRRFTSSTNVKPSTTFGLSVELVGFGSGAKGGPARMCRG